MNIGWLKKTYEHLPDGIKIAAAPIIRNRLIKNNVFIEQYEKLDRMGQLTREEIQQQQLTDLKSLLIYAYEQTIYYKNLFDSVHFNPYQLSEIGQLSLIPLLTRTELEENFQTLQADTVKNFYHVTTGGTTGKPIHLLLERDSIYREKAFIYHFWSQYGYDYKKSRLITFRGIQFHGKIAKVNPLYNEIILNPFLLNSSTLEKYIKKIERFRAEFFHGYPSAIYHFCCLLKQCGRKLKTKITAVFFISENVLPAQKSYIENVLGCKAHALYGHSERAVFGEETKSGYHFNPAYGVTEVLKDSDGLIIATGFLNRKMPLIRYCTDDCALENRPQYYSITGRRSVDVIYGRNKERISMAAVNFHDETFAKVEAYQFEQNEVGKVLLRVTSIEPLSRDELSRIACAVKEKFQDRVDTEVTQVSDIPLTARGKYRMVIQSVKPADETMEE